MAGLRTKKVKKLKICAYAILENGDHTKWLPNKRQAVQRDPRKRCHAD